jgi:hypothetical protein
MPQVGVQFRKILFRKAMLLAFRLGVNPSEGQAGFIRKVAFPEPMSSKHVHRPPTTIRGKPNGLVVNRYQIVLRHASEGPPKLWNCATKGSRKRFCGDGLAVMLHLQHLSEHIFKEGSFLMETSLL